MNYLIIGDPSGVHTYTLIQSGISPSDIFVWEDSAKGQYCVTMEGVNVIEIINGDHTDLDKLMGKFTVIANPPYGSGGNLAIKFLNKCGDLSDDIRIVMPISIRKPSSQNKVRLDLVCVEDIDLPPDTFGKNITAVRQRWVKTDSVREKIATFTTHPDFEFVKKTENPNVMIGRTGMGPTGKVFLSDFDHYRIDHHYISCSEEVANKLKSLQQEFITISGLRSNGMRSLSKHELITVYMERYGRGKIQTHTTHPDFEFVKKTETPDCMIFRCGASTGKVVFEFEDNKPDHYYIKATSDIVKRLQSISEELVSISRNVNGMPGISKHDLITTYVTHYE